MTNAAGDEVLDEQIAYYRARAPEYDDWFIRRGRYDRGPEATRRWFEQVDQVRAALAAVPLDGGDVVELAPGTGLWTREIVGRVRHLTAVDASSEMVAINRDALGEDAARVTFVTADVFNWDPPRTFDAVVFCFWISHVPARRLDDFLAWVVGLLRPGGAVFFVDARREPTSTAADHVLPGGEEELMTRRLDDGREFRIVKNFWEAHDLEARCARVGLDVAVTETADYFQYGSGRRR